MKTVAKVSEVGRVDLGGAGAMLPVYLRGDVVAEARVDEDLLGILSSYRWIYNPTKKQAYRVEEGDGDRPPRQIPLQREVMGFTHGDGRTVGFRSPDTMDCRRENLLEGRPRDITGYLRPGGAASWPKKPESMISYWEKRSSDEVGRRMLRLLSAAEIESYGRKRIVLSYEPGGDETKEGLLAATQAWMQERLFEAFGFIVEVSTYSRPAVTGGAMKRREARQTMGGVMGTGNETAGGAAPVLTSGLRGTMELRCDPTSGEEGKKAFLTTVQSLIAMPGVILTLTAVLGEKS